MAYCGPRGIPYTTFLAWDDLSQSAALAWQDREADRCGGCGQFRADWLDADGVELRDRPAIVVESFCPACDDLGRARKASEGDDRPGVHLAFRHLHPAPAPDAPARSL